MRLHLKLYCLINPGELACYLNCRTEGPRVDRHCKLESVNSAFKLNLREQLQCDQTV